MDPIGRFLQAVAPLGKRTTDLRPGMQVRAVVVQHRGGDYFLLQVGSQRVTAQSHLQLQPGQNLNVRVEQGADGLVFRVLNEAGPSSTADRLVRVLAAQVGSEATAELHTLVDSFIQIGIPLSEAYTVPAFRQLSRLLRDFPALRGRMREVSRLLAMFSDRGMQVPDDIIMGVLAYGDDEPSHRHPQQHPGQNPHRQNSPEDAPENSGENTPENSGEGDTDSAVAVESSAIQGYLQLPDTDSAVDPGLAVLASTRHREPPWLVVPFRFGQGSRESQLQGTLRLQMNGQTVARTVLDVPLPDDRWVFSWIPGSDQPMRVYTRSGGMPDSVATALYRALEGSGISPPESVEEVQRWDGFASTAAADQAEASPDNVKEEPYA